MIARPEPGTDMHLLCVNLLVAYSVNMTVAGSPAPRRLVLVMNASGRAVGPQVKTVATACSPAYKMQPHAR